MHLDRRMLIGDCGNAGAMYNFEDEHPSYVAHFQVATSRDIVTTVFST
jgi:hypothetical protein